VYRILQERVKPLGSLKRYTTNWYQSEGFETKPRWASGTVFGPRMRREIGSGRPISDPSLLQNVKESLDEFFIKLKRYSGVMKPQPVWYESTGREDSTPESVGALGSVREGRRALVTVISGECAQGLQPLDTAQEVTATPGV
jgi:hypothetical protein